MDIRSEITDTIAKIQNEVCLKCPKGKILLGLRDLRDSLDGNGADQTVTGGNAAQKRKLQKKTAKYKIAGKACRVCGKELPFSEFPKNKSCTGGRAGTCKACCYDRAKRNKKQRSDPPIEAAAKYECKLCHAPASSPERLASHMRTVHGQTSV